jgi:hypothetical protein
MRFAVLLLLAASVAPAAEIPKGSHTLLRLMNSVSTRTAREGDFIYFRTATPIVNQGTIVVPAESYVQGVITRSVRSGRVKGRAELAIRIDTLTLASGQVVKLTPTLKSVDDEGSDQKVLGGENEIKQGGSKGTDAGTIARTAGLGAGIGGLADRGWRGAGIGAGVGSGVGLATVLLTRGREVEIHQGSTIDVVFERPVPLN